MTSRLPLQTTMPVAADLSGRSWWRRVNVVHLFALAAAVAVLIYAASVAVLPRRYGHIVVGDGVHYYVYLRSLVHDGDLDFANDYAVFNEANQTDPTKRVNIEARTPTGLTLNMFSIGPALLATPLYLVAHGMSLAGRAAGLPLRVDGYGYLYEGAFAVTGVLASVVGAACAYAALRRLLPVGPALLGVGGAWLAGSLLYYTLASPVYAHAASALGVAAWLLVWSRLRPDRLAHWLVFGVVGGLMATMRWQEALIAGLPLLFWLLDLTRGRGATAGALATASGPHASSPALPRVLLTPLVYAIGLALGFAPQMAAWTVLFGAPLALPQGSSFFAWSDPRWLDVLISTRNGLFTWTPVALLGVGGLGLLARRHPRWAAVGLIALLAQVALNGLIFDWWGGAAFGARRFCGVTVFLALGLGWLVHLIWPTRQRLALGVVALLITLNGLLVVQYSAFLKGWTHMDTYPTLRQMTIERFTWPLDFLRSRRVGVERLDVPLAASVGVSAVPPEVKN